MAGYFHLRQKGADTLIPYNKDGASGGAAFATLMTFRNAQASSFKSANFEGGVNPNGTGFALEMTGTNGDDILNGGLLNDRISGGPGKDTLDGKAGDDVIEGGDGNDTLSDALGNNVLLGGDGDDTISASSTGINRLEGGAGDDLLIAGRGTDTLLGDAGNDSIFIDTSESQASRKIEVYGGQGDDIVFFAGGSEAGASIVLAGGEGRDTYYFRDWYSSKVTVTDFAAGPNGDIINIQEVFDAPGNPFAANGGLRLIQRGTDAVLQTNHVQGSPQSSYKDLLVLSGTSVSSITADNFLNQLPLDGTARPVNLVGGSGDDSLLAGFFKDTIFGGAGKDRLFGYHDEDVLDGGDGDDYLNGGWGNDILRGGAGDDRFDDFDGDDQMDGGAGNDTFYSYFGKTSVLGGSGIDVLRFVGSQRDYTVTLDKDGGASVTPKPEMDFYGSVKATEVERIHFTGMNGYALDVNGNAGQVYRVYQAAFDRTPDLAGLGYWIAMVDRGMPMSAVTAGFVQSDEFSKLYGSAPNNAQLVDRYYQNVLHRTPDSAGRDYWIGLLDKGTLDAAAVLGEFSQSAENVAAAATVIGQGFNFTIFTG